MRRGLAFMVAAARWFLTFVKPYPTCRYLPSCSHYAQDAIRVHGCVRGSALAAWRIMRCNPFSPGGIDPIVERREA